MTSFSMVDVCCREINFFPCPLPFSAIEAIQSKQETFYTGVEVGINTQVQLKELESGWGFSLVVEQTLSLILNPRREN